MALPADVAKLHSYLIGSYIFSTGTSGQRANAVVGPGGGRLVAAGCLTVGAPNAGTNVFHLRLNGSPVSPVVTMSSVSPSLGDYQLLNLDTPIEVEAGDVISWHTNGGGEDGWTHFENLIEGRGDAGLFATYGTMDLIDTADDDVALPVPLDAELIGFGVSTVDTATDDISTITIERWKGTTVADDVNDDPGVTFDVPVLAVNAGALIMLDEGISFRAGDGLLLVTDGNSGTGAEINFLAFWKSKQSGILCATGHIVGFGATGSGVRCGAIRRGTIRRLACAYGTANTAVGQVCTVNVDGAAAGPTWEVPGGSGGTTIGQGFIVDHGEVFVEEGAAIEHRSDEEGSAGAAYAAVLIQQ